jgi:O-6-methylguanine DNA methyltransferase
MTASENGELNSAASEILIQWNRITKPAMGHFNGALAREFGSPKPVRAVGLANAANPIAIIVRCHGVIGADQSLTGYGGGINRKRSLLTRESAAFDARRSEHCDGRA